LSYSIDVDLKPMPKRFECLVKPFLSYEQLKMHPTAMLIKLRKSLMMSQVEYCSLCGCVNSKVYQPDRMAASASGQ